MPPKDALTTAFGPPYGSGGDGSGETQATAAVEGRVRRNPMEGVGKWSKRLERAIIEEDYIDALQTTLQRLPWAKGTSNQRSRERPGHSSDL